MTNGGEIRETRKSTHLVLFPDRNISVISFVVRSFEIENDYGLKLVTRYRNNGNCENSFADHVYLPYIEVVYTEPPKMVLCMVSP